MSGVARVYISRFASASVLLNTAAKAAAASLTTSYLGRLPTELIVEGRGNTDLQNEQKFACNTRLTTFKTSEYPMCHFWCTGSTGEIL